MYDLTPTTEADMVAVFLKTEIASSRFSEEILILLQRDWVDRRIVDLPDLSNRDENQYRIKLLGDFRGYGQNRALFKSFPADVDWNRAVLAREEILEIRYIDYSYWNELSGDTRSPVAAAGNIRAGVEVYGQSNQGFLDLAKALQNGVDIPELILVAPEPGADLTVLEGHARLTAYALYPEALTHGVEVMVGYSERLSKWEWKSIHGR